LVDFHCWKFGDAIMVCEEGDLTTLDAIRGTFGEILLA
jgi:hypothetical protein